MTAVDSAIDEWISSLHVDQISAEHFRGRAQPGRPNRVFGGLAMGQAVMAATRSIADSGFVMRSLHCDFLRAGDPREPIDFQVVATSDGRRFRARRVVARQSQTTLFNLLLRLHAPEDGPDHQVAMPTGLPDPLSLTDYPTRLQPHAARLPDWSSGNLPIDLRMIDDGVADGQRMWLRAVGKLPDEPFLHACALIYASDMTLLGSAVVPFGLTWASPGVQMASLDHSMWFHRPCRADDWMLYEQRVLSSESSRGLVQGQLFGVDGRLLATVMQDGVVRVTSSGG